LHKYFSTAQTAFLEELTKKKQIDDDLRKKLHAAMKEYKENFAAEHSAAAATA
jgi:F-type H+-transporting ATPase subunit alpha